MSSGIWHRLHGTSAERLPVFDGLKAGNDCNQIASLPSLSLIAFARPVLRRVAATAHTRQNTRNPARPDRRGFLSPAGFSGATVPDTAGKTARLARAFFIGKPHGRKYRCRQKGKHMDGYQRQYEPAKAKGPGKTPAGSVTAGDAK